MSTETARLEPLGLGQLFDRSLKLYRRHLRLIVALSGLAFAATFIVTMPQMNVANVVFDDLMQGAETKQFEGVTSLEAIGKLILLILSATIMGTLAEGLVVQAAGELYLGRPVGFRDSLQKFLPKIPKLVLTRLLALVVYGIITAVGLVAMPASFMSLSVQLSGRLLMANFSAQSPAPVVHKPAPWAPVRTVSTSAAECELRLLTVASRLAVVSGSMAAVSARMD